VEMTTREAAEKLGISGRDVRRLFQAGKIKGRVVNPRLTMLDGASVQRYATHHENGAAKKTARPAPTKRATAGKKNAVTPRSRKKS